MDSSGNFLDKFSRLTESEGVKFREAALVRQHEEQARAYDELDMTYEQMVADRTKVELEKEWAETRSIAWFAADALHTGSIKPTNFLNYLPTYQQQGWLRKRDVFVSNEDHYAFDGWVLEKFPDYVIDQFSRAGYSDLSSIPAGGYGATLMLQSNGEPAFIHKNTLNLESRSFTWNVSTLPNEDTDVQTLLHAGILHTNGRPYDGTDMESRVTSEPGDIFKDVLNISPLDLVEISYGTLCMHENGDDFDFSRIRHEDSKQYLLESLKDQVNLANEVQIRIARLLASHAINVK